jgi:hypothetical protein
MDNSKVEALKELKGQAVVRVEPLDDGAIRLGFSNGHILTVYNDWVLGPSLSREAEVLLGNVLEAALSTSFVVLLGFHRGIRLSIDLNKDAHHRHQAVIIERPGQPDVVWHPKN